MILWYLERIVWWFILIPARRQMWVYNRTHRYVSPESSPAPRRGGAFEDLISEVHRGQWDKHEAYARSLHNAAQQAGLMGSALQHQQMMNQQDMMRNQFNQANSLAAQMQMGPLQQKEGAKPWYVGLY